MIQVAVMVDRPFARERRQPSTMLAWFKASEKITSPSTASAARTPMFA